MCKNDEKFNNLYLREAVMEDMMLLFCWVNDPVVRQSSFCADEIALAAHRKWFENAMLDANTKIYILQRGELPVGQVRIELGDSGWNIGYSIDAAWRGKGYGRIALQLLERMVSDGTWLLGEVKFKNVASQKVFEDLEYTKSVNANKSSFEYRKCVADIR